MSEEFYITVSELYRDKTIGIWIDRNPDFCPRCNKHVVPQQIDGRIVKSNCLQVAYQCTNRDCQELFIAYYSEDFPSTNHYSLEHIAPMAAKEEIFSKEIQTISPDFIKIFNQAVFAEDNGLELIAGVGYRKSLEFLLKDYLIEEHPEIEDEIKATFLSTCITKWVDDPRLKTTATLATWLGNDETHYVKKWETKDINDLKKLIRLTINWVDSCLLTKSYEEDMF